ncbi:MAG: TerS protein [Rubrivivax sp.]|nr:TerS protein [Rubrivivax sp.]
MRLWSTRARTVWFPSMNCLSSTCPENTMATRKVKSDSASAAVKTLLAAAVKAIEPPAHVHLRDGDRSFWCSVVRARARDEWSETDLVLAAQLARCLADIEREQKMLDTEGVLIVNDRGMSVVNPRVSVAEQFARRAQALARTLRMGGRAAGRSADMQHGRRLERAARRLQAETPDDGLLA